MSESGEIVPISPSWSFSELQAWSPMLPPPLSPASGLPSDLLPDRSTQVQRYPINHPDYSDTNSYRMELTTSASNPSTQVALQPELSPMCHHHDSDANSYRMEQRTSASSLGSDILPSSTSMLPSDFLLDQSTQVALPPELSPTCHHHDSDTNSYRMEQRTSAWLSGSELPMRSTPLFAPPLWNSVSPPVFQSDLPTLRACLSPSAWRSVPSLEVALQSELYPISYHHDSDTTSNWMEQCTVRRCPECLCTFPIDLSFAAPYLTRDPGIHFSEIVSAVEHSWYNYNYDFARTLLREIVNCLGQYEPKLVSLFERVRVDIIIAAGAFHVIFTGMQRNRNGGKYCATSEKDGPLNALRIWYGKEWKDQMSRDGPDRDGKEWLLVSSDPGAEGEIWDYFKYLEPIFWLFRLETQSCINMGLKMLDYKPGIIGSSNIHILSSQQPNAPGVEGPRVADFQELAFNADENSLFSKVERLLHSKMKILSWSSIEGNQKLPMYLPSDRYAEPSEVVCGGFECQNDAFPRETNPIPIERTEIGRAIHVPETQNNAAFSAEKCPRNMIERKHKARRRTIGLEHLQQCYGMKLEEAANYLNVSRSTLKRICRKYEISNWSSLKTCMLNGSVRSVKGKSSANIRDQNASQHPEAFVVCQQDSQHPQPPESLAIENVLPISSTSTIEQTRFDSLEGSKRRERVCFHEKKRKNSSNSLCKSVPINPPDERMVIIKATYGEDTIRVKFSLKLGLEQLMKEISKRIKLETSSFNIKYWDGDQELILIACEDDLKDCVEMLGSHDNDTIKLQVHEKVAK